MLKGPELDALRDPALEDLSLIHLAMLLWAWIGRLLREASTVQNVAPPNQNLFYGEVLG